MVTLPATGPERPLPLLQVALRDEVAGSVDQLLGEQLPAHALRVHARLPSGSSILLLDATPLTPAVVNALSFYVWAARDGEARAQFVARGGSNG